MDIPKWWWKSLWVAGSTQVREQGCGSFMLTPDHLNPGSLPIPCSDFTGPMYQKYNSVLRFFSGASRYASAGKVPFLQKQCEQLGLGTWQRHK